MGRHVIGDNISVNDSYQACSVNSYPEDYDNADVFSCLQ